MRTNDAARLSLLPPALKDAGYESPDDYLTLWKASINGVIPTFQINGRWHYWPKDVPEIARVLRLRKRQTIAA
jgi:hypothetical protein